MFDEANFRGVTVVASAARSGKTELLLSQYRRSLSAGRPGAALWIAPTRRSVAEVRGRLVGAGLPGCFRPHCYTFQQFAQAVLDHAEMPMRPLNDLMKRTLLRSLVGDAIAQKKLPYFEPIAQTPGLLDSLSELISELKRLEVWPDQLLAACKARGISPKDREICLLYHGYQELLNEHALYDAEGRFWSARRLLREGQQRPFEQVQAVFVDGFTDFTRTQHEILEILASRVDSLVITLPLEREPRRDDLFAKSLATMQELQRRHPQLVVHELPRPAKPDWPALAHLEAELFKNPRVVRPAKNTQGIEILAASRQIGEIEAIARQLKQLLTQGDRGKPVRPSEIAVVFRSVAEVSDLVEEIFREYGVPVALDEPHSLARCGAMVALLNLLRLDLDDWPFRDLLAVLSNNYIQLGGPDNPSAGQATAAEHVIRELQIPSGRQELLNHLRRWAKRAEPRTDESPDAPANRRMQGAERARLALPLLERLEDVLASLPRTATPGEWVAALQQLAGAVGLAANKESGDSPADEPDEVQAAWEQLTAALFAQERLAEWLGQDPPRWNRRELFEQLTDILHCESLPRRADPTGCVQVLNAGSARNVSCAYVFLVGLSEKAFPRPDREGRLYGDEEYNRLMAAGLQLVPRAQRSQEEMLLFYEIVTRPTRQLYLSYPALDEKAQPLSPSPYLTEVERACGPGAIARREDVQLSPIPQGAELFSPRDVRVKAIAQALDGDLSRLRELGGCEGNNALGNIVAALRMTHARQQGNGFGPFEGMLAGKEAARQLAERFGPERCWSPSQLEQYASCPYRFFLERVAQLEPLEDLALEVDYLVRGRILHGLMASLHRRVNERNGGPGTPCMQQAEQLAQDVEELLQAILERLQSDRPLENSLREVDRRILLEWIANYRAQHLKYDQQWQEFDQPLAPAYFEVAFGPKHEGADSEAELDNGDGDGLSIPRPLELACGQEVVRFSGRIDRIDVGVVAGQTVFNIVDYKSGASARLSPKAIEEGLALQLPLYALAVQELLLAEQQAIPWRAAYWYVKDQGYREALAFGDHSDGRPRVSDQWESLRSRLLARVLSLVQGIRQGQFPMHSADQECTSYCSYNTVCRVNQARSLEKSWQPPVVELV